MSRKQAAIKAKFAELDKNGDGFLDFKELKDLLKAGGSFSDKEVKALYNNCDADGDHRISFDEFVDYIYSQDKSGSGRHARLHEASSVSADASEGDWRSVEDVFVAFAGKDMDGREFAKFCGDNGLFDRKFKKTDTDIIFAKVVPRGKRRMDFAMFQDACRHVAKKKDVPTGDLQALIASSEGPVLHATKADAVRFHDDKSTYTGAHTYNAHHTGVDASASHGRHDRLAAASAVTHDAEDAWDEVDAVFDAFAQRDGSLDSHEFSKMCHEISGLMGRGFNKSEVDIVFTEACAKNGRARKMNATIFQDAVRIIAKRKGVRTFEVQDIVKSAEGPVLTATKAAYTRFHDDHSTYTGSKAEGRKDDRHGRLAAERASLEGESTEEHDWSRALQVLDIFMAGDGQLDGTEFYKMMGDCGIIDRVFKRTDCDVVFTSAAGRSRKIGPDGFKVAIRAIAKRKEVAVWKVQQQVEQCEGPHSTATKAEAVRFHDDKYSYTGMHAGKHIG